MSIKPNSTLLFFLNQANFPKSNRDNTDAIKLTLRRNHKYGKPAAPVN